MLDRFWNKVDQSGECWTWTACKQSDGYGMFKLDGRMQLAHRLSYSWEYGTIPDRSVIDHTCYTRSCVRPSHLRAVTNKENGENRSDTRSNSGVRNVYWDKKVEKWHVRVKHNYKSHFGGSFCDLELATAAAITLRNELFTHNIEKELSR